MMLRLAGVQEIKSVSLSYRDPADSYLKNINKVIEGPIGSNLLNNGNLSYNIEQLKSSSRRISNEAHLSEANMRYSAQTGETAPSDAKVFILPDATLDNIDKLDKDDVLILTIKTGSGEIENIMPVQNYLRAQNWAYSTQ